MGAFNLDIVQRVQTGGEGPGRIRPDEPAVKVVLSQGWKIQSSTDVREKGEILSTPEFRPEGWYPTTVPSTVLAALVHDQVYSDPYFGKNLRSIPGASYPIGDQYFATLPMSPDNPFRVPWWYRTEFTLPADYQDKTVWLHFDAINYRANVWLNGHQIATAEKMVGAWRFRVQHFAGGLAGPGQLPCRRSVSTPSRRPGNQFRGLESPSS